METEELGSVYESLLELTPRLIADGHGFAFAEAGEAKGNARKTSGSYDARAGCGGSWFHSPENRGTTYSDESAKYNIAGCLGYRLGMMPPNRLFTTG